MSNTATSIAIIALSATPLGMAAALIGGTVVFHRWLSNSTPEDIACVENLKDELRRERLLRPGQLAMPRDTSITAATLHTRSSEPLRQTAEKLGYRVIRPLSRDSQILLARPSGERLAIGHNDKGQVTVSANKESQVKKLVRCHTVDNAISHLRSKGMSVQAQPLPSGEIQIIGREQRASHDGSARVTTNVRSDGSMLIDVDDLNSNRCESIVTELADAVGGNISDVKSKTGHRLPVSNMRKVRI